MNNYKKILLIIFVLFLSISLIACKNNEENNKEEEEPVCDHYFNKVKTKPATCTENGHKAYYECELCGYIEDYEEIEALGHDYILQMGKNATDKEDGYTDYYVCSRCGDIKDKEAISAFGHIHDSLVLEYVEASKASCGYQRLKCSICGYEYMEYMNILNRKEIFMDEIKILMVGNSFTNFNTLIELMSEMFKQEGLNISVYKFSYGNQYLYDYIEGERGDYYDELVKFMKNKHYDVVFLQEQSNNAFTNKEDFCASVRALYKYFTDLGSSVALYETWSYREGYGDLTYLQMSAKLSESYAYIANELGLKVSRCGQAFKYMYINHNDMDMNNTDGSHPSTLGTYLVALTHYATITGRSPIGINYTYNDYLKNEKITWHSKNERVDISKEEQAYLEQAAYDAVFLNN